MIICLLSDPAKSGLKCGAWVVCLPEQRQNITITKNKSLLFFRAVYHSKNHVIPHPVIAAFLDVILHIFQC